MNADIFVLVRLSNTRLPGKAMKMIDDRPVLKYLVDRLQSAKKIKNIIVCTTTSESDDILVDYLKSENIMYFRGPEKDVLVRLLEAARKFNTDLLVCVDGDDIYTDPNYVDEIILTYEKNSYDYIDMVGFPFGIASVGIKKSALETICKLKKTSDTDTGYRLFFTQNNIFNVHHLKPKKDISFPANMRLTLDYEEDLILANRVFGRLGNNFQLDDILELFRKEPQLLEITEGLEEKYKEHWNKNLANTSITDNY